MRKVEGGCENCDGRPATGVWVGEGGTLAMVYDRKNGRYLRPAAAAVGDLVGTARALTAATGAGMIVLVISEGVMYYADNKDFRNFVYCRISRTISMFTDTDIYEDDC